MNYPYDILWTRSHGSYRDAHSLELACPLLFIYGTVGWSEPLRLDQGSSELSRLLSKLGFELHW